MPNVPITLRDISIRNGLTTNRADGSVTAVLFEQFFATRFAQHMHDFDRVADVGYASEWAGRFARGNYSEYYHGDKESRAILRRLAPGAYPPPGFRE
jgi:hypothetical protein